VDTEAGSLAPGEEFEVQISLSGPGTLAVRYLLVDTATREVVYQGEARPVTETDFVIRLDADATAELKVGLYRLLLAAYSGQLAQMTERRLQLEASLPLPEETVQTPVAEVSPTVEVATPTVEATGAPLPAETPAPPPAPKPGFPVGAIIGVVAVIAILGAIVFFWRRGASLLSR
jgi:hypothetical protein